MCVNQGLVYKKPAQMDKTVRLNQHKISGSLGLLIGAGREDWTKS